MTNSTRSIAELAAKIKAIPRDKYDYLEVKQLAEILNRHRIKLRASITEYRTLKSALETQQDAVERLYLGYESLFMRDQLRDAWRLYRLVSIDFHVAFSTYMKAAANAPTLPSFIYSQDVKDTGLSHSRRSAA